MATEDKEFSLMFQHHNGEVILNITDNISSIRFLKIKMKSHQFIDFIRGTLIETDGELILEDVGKKRLVDQIYVAKQKNELSEEEICEYINRAVAEYNKITGRQWKPRSYSEYNNMHKWTRKAPEYSFSYNESEDDERGYAQILVVTWV